MKLTTKKAIFVTILYMVLSIGILLVAELFFGSKDNFLYQPPPDQENPTNIESVIDISMIANWIISLMIIISTFTIFRKDKRDIYFEKIKFHGSKLYFVFPAIWIILSLIALYLTDLSQYTVMTIFLTGIASLAIGINEELISRGILIVGLRNSGHKEWVVWLASTLIFAALHLINLIGGGSFGQVLVVFMGGTILYVSRRLFGNIFIPILMHAFYDTSFYLLSGYYEVGQDLPDNVLDFQLSAFLVMAGATVIFVVFGRGMLRGDVN